MARCIFKITGATRRWNQYHAKDESLYQCVACERNVWSIHGPERIIATCHVTGPGDWLTLWLANYGVTKWKYLETKRWLYAKLGMPEPKSCGCGGRAETLNSLWYDVKARIKTLKQKVTHGIRDRT